MALVTQRLSAQGEERGDREVPPAFALCANLTQNAAVHDEQWTPQRLGRGLYGLDSPVVGDRYRP